MNQYNFKSIRRNSRLRRYAILINEGKGLTQIYNVIKYISRLWGGYETHIIPYSKSGIDGVFLKQLREFDPDYIYSWENEEIPEWIMDKIKKNTNPFISIEHDILHPMRQRIVYPHVDTEHIFDKISSGLLNINVIDNEDKNNKLFLALIALTGVIECEIPNLYKENISNASLYLREKYERYYQCNMYYPFDLTLEGVYKYKHIHRYEKDAIFIIGDSLKSFCLYFNLSRYNDLVFWINEDTLKETYIQGIRDYFEDMEKIKGYKIKTITIINDNLDINIINKININLEFRITKKLGLKELINHKFENHNFGIYNKVDKWEGIWFNGLSTVEEVKAQDFLGFEKEDATKFRYLTEIEIKDYKFINKLNAVTQKHNKSMKYRLSKKGVVFESIRPVISNDNLSIEENLINIMFEQEPLNENITKLLSESKRSWGISNQGKYASKILSKFNNDIGVLSDYINDINYKNIFDKYIDGDKKNKPGIVLRNRRRYFTYENICEITSEKIAQEFINDMVKRNIIKRGYLIKCNECAHAFWISLNNINENITCNQCDCNLFYTYDLSRFGESEFEPKIYYKLDEIFYHAWNNDFYVPILALNYFRRQSKEYFDHMNEIDIYDEEGNKFAEIDFICNVDGKLIIGECKKNNVIENRQIGKYIAIAIDCGFDEVIFVTLETWTESTKSIFIDREKTLNEQGIKLIILEEDDLI